MLDVVDKLCRLEEPFDHQPELFAQAMAEAFAHHYERCESYRRYCCEQGFHPDGKVPLEEAPWIFVDVFKRHELLSVPRSEVVLHVTSSGTSGQKSQNFFDQPSLDRLQAMLEGVFRAFGMTDPEQEVNYLLFSYDPAEAPDLGTAFTSTNWTRFTGKGEVFYAIRKDRRGEFAFDEQGALDALRRFGADSRPARIIGFPSFLHRLLERGPRVALPARSLILTGGGWKTYADGEVPRQTFLARIADELGVAPEQVRDNYGMVEHGAPYVQCEAHQFHVPVFCRALAREVSTLEPLPHGEVGFLHLLTPYHGAVPNHSLLTSDLASIEQGCPCGRNAPVIRLAGRGGIRKHAGCAIAAAQILRPVS